MCERCETLLECQCGRELWVTQITLSKGSIRCACCDSFFTVKTSGGYEVQHFCDLHYFADWWPGKPAVGLAA